MNGSLNIAFFGSSLGYPPIEWRCDLLPRHRRALNFAGHRVTFFEPTHSNVEQHKDMEEPEWATVHVYSAEGTAGVDRALE